MAQPRGCLNIAAGGCLRAVLGIFLLPILLVSGLFLVLNTERVLNHEPVEAVIVDLIASTDSDGDTVYKPVYEYQVDGSTYRYESQISIGGIGVPSIGDHKTLLYDPNDPGNARVRNYFLLLILPAIGVLIPLLILAAFVWGAIRRRRRTINDPLPEIVVPPWSSSGEPPWEPPQQDVAYSTTIEAIFMGTEPSQMDASGDVKYRVKARAEIDGELRRFVGDWVDEDPTLMFMELGNKVEVRIDPIDPNSYEVVMPTAD